MDFFNGEQAIKLQDREIPQGFIFEFFYVSALVRVFIQHLRTQQPWSKKKHFSPKLKLWFVFLLSLCQPKNKQFHERCINLERVREPLLSWNKSVCVSEKMCVWERVCVWEKVCVVNKIKRMCVFVCVCEWKVCVWECVLVSGEKWIRLREREWVWLN